MTCTYGASVKSGVDPNQQIPVDRSLWESVTGAPSSWLDPLLDTFTQEYIKASDLCALNLADPTLPSTADIVACVTQPWSCLPSVHQWIRDKLRYAAFADNCSCNAPAGGLCPNGSHSSSPYTGSNAGYLTWDGYSSVPAGTDHIRVYPNVRSCANNSAVIGMEVYWKNGSGVETHLTGCGQPCNTVDDPTRYCEYSTPGIAQIAYGGFTTIGGTSYTVQPYVNYFYSCSATTPPAPTKPSQPTDYTVTPSWSCSTTGDLCTRLQQIEQRLLSVQGLVTLIQRQRAPFAYVTGAGTSISGSGVVAVQGILGVSLALSDSRSGITNYPDNPDTYFDLGWLSFCTADGCQDARPIRRHNDVILEVSPAITSVRYTLPSGVSGTLTPLLRQP